MNTQEKNSEIETFPQRLRKAVDISGKSQARIAQEVGIKPPYLSQILSGKVGVKDYERKKKLADATNVSLQWLISGEGPPYRSEATKITDVSDEAKELIQARDAMIDGLLKMAAFFPDKKVLEMARELLDTNNIESAKILLDELLKRQDTNIKK